ncbi:MAG: GtrA family protein, partial [Thermoleophilaceae bacterium]|nr:GtrA family protein [Thermoleophilaceae bacterium]
MSDPTAKPEKQPASGLTARVAKGTLKPSNWMQLMKFGAVGASGYVINLIVFKIAIDKFDAHYMLAAVLAFIVAVTNNFLLNRYWTFDAAEGHAGFQAARFLTVSLIALAFNLVMLKFLVTVGKIDEFTAQAIAVVLATPLNFVGNKLWSFRG